MKTRIISAVILAPIFLIIIFLGGDILKYSLLILSLVGLNEFFKAIDGENKSYHYFSYIFTIIYYIALDNSLFYNYFDFDLLFITNSIIFILGLFIYLVLKYPKVNINNISTTILGTLYIPIFFSFLYTVRVLSFEAVWFILITAFATDSFAYFVGVFFGKNKLIPHLSPNKTIEGSVGGIVGAIVCCIIYSFIILWYITPDILYSMNFSTKEQAILPIIIFSVIVGLICSIMAQFGDLTASSIKRLTKVKDFGKLIPGHGGILDRFDSILFTAPVLYIILTIFIELNNKG